jgi:hypothetical protein
MNSVRDPGNKRPVKIRRCHSLDIVSGIAKALRFLPEPGDSPAYFIQVRPGGKSLSPQGLVRGVCFKENSFWGKRRRGSHSLPVVFQNNGPKGKEGVHSPPEQGFPFSPGSGPGMKDNGGNFFKRGRKGENFVHGPAYMQNHGKAVPQGGFKVAGEHPLLKLFPGPVPGVIEIKTRFPNRVQTAFRRKAPEKLKAGVR